VILNYRQCQKGDLFVDFATELTPRIAEALANAGVRGVMQYTPYDTAGRAKYGSAKEAQIAHDHDMYYMLNWEIQADRALGGYPVGSSDGRRNRAALRAMGYPEQVSAPVSVDMNTLYGNIDAVAGFCKGHFETDGDLADINFSYLDTDGGRALEAKGIDVCIWIPGAFYWSPELYPLRNNRAALMAKASENPQAYCIQFPSEDFQGLLRIDRNIVLKPFNVWCAPYEVDTDKPDHIDVIVPPQPDNNQGDDMACIINPVPTEDEPDIGSRNPFLLDAGYATGVSGVSLGGPLPVLPVSASVWDELIQTSNTKKAADQVLKAGLSTGTGGGGAAPTKATGTVDLNAGKIDLTLS